MSSYIYTMSEGADPAAGWVMNDPIYGRTPTLGACVPHFRRNVKVGDWFFTISGRVKNERQYVVGGFKVKEKIDHLAAYKRFPDLRVRQMADGHIEGNIIVTANGKHNPVDTHGNFEDRIENYIVGGNPIVLNDAAEVERARAETLAVLGRIFGKPGNRVFDVIGRGRKMEAEQVEELRNWMLSLKR